MLLINGGFPTVSRRKCAFLDFYSLSFLYLDGGGIECSRVVQIVELVFLALHALGIQRLLLPLRVVNSSQRSFRIAQNEVSCRLALDVALNIMLALI